MTPEQTERLRAVRALIDSDWGKDHFNLHVEVDGDLYGAYERDETGCGAAGCVAGFLPLVNPRIKYYSFKFKTHREAFSYIGIVRHEEGFGLSWDEAWDLCSTGSYSPAWTREEVLRRIDKLLIEAPA